MLRLIEQIVCLYFALPIGQGVYVIYTDLHKR